jgi:hypothetical protein
MNEQIETNEDGPQSEEGVDQVKVFVGVADAKVILQFDSEIAWIRLSPEQANTLAGMLQQKAQEATVPA